MLLHVGYSHKSGVTKRNRVARTVSRLALGHTLRSWQMFSLAEPEHWLPKAASWRWVVIDFSWNALYELLFCFYFYSCSLRCFSFGFSVSARMLLCVTYSLRKSASIFNTINIQRTCADRLALTFVPRIGKW